MSRNSYSRSNFAPSMTSSYSGSGISSRYGNSENVMSRSLTSYRPPAPSSSTISRTFTGSDSRSSYRAPSLSRDSDVTRSTPSRDYSSISSSYRPPKEHSVSRDLSRRDSGRDYSRSTLSSSRATPTRDYTSGSRDYSTRSTTSGLDRYRTPERTMNSSTRPPLPSYSSLSSSTTTTSAAAPRVRFQVRSVTPTSGLYDRPSSRIDREYRSMSRFDREDSTPVTADRTARSRPSADRLSTDRELAEVEKRFQRLYDRYVTPSRERDTDGESDAEISIRAPTRKFISHSEAEEESTDDERGVDDAFAAELKALALQRKHSVVSPGSADATPLPSAAPSAANTPLVERRQMPPQNTPNKESSTEVKLIPAKIEARKLKPAASEMEKMMRLNEIITNMEVRAVEKKEEKAAEPKTVANGITGKPIAQIKPKEQTVEKPAVKKVEEERGKEKLKEKEKEKSEEPSTRKTSAGQKIVNGIANTFRKFSFGGKAEEKEGNITKERPPKKQKADVMTSSTISLPSRPSLASLSSLGAPPPAIIIEPPSPTENPKKVRARSRSVKKIKKSEDPSSLIAVDDKKTGEERASAEPANEASEKTDRRRNRTLENLKQSLEPILQAKRAQQIKMSASEKEESPVSDTGKNDVEAESTLFTILPRPPLLLVTHPDEPETSTPSSPATTSANIVLPWSRGAQNGSEMDDEEEYTDEEYTDEEFTDEEYSDEEEFESDFEYSVSETFNIDPLPVPPANLATHSPGLSPMVSDYEHSDQEDDKTPFLPDKAEDSRNRVARLFAVPPPPAPIFTASFIVDGLDDDEWDENDGGPATYSFRPGSSMFLSPEVSSDEDYDGEAVGATLTLVQKAAMKDGEETDTDEYYDSDEEYSDEEYWDEDEDEEEYTDEEFTDEEYTEEDEEEEMHSMEESGDERSPSPLLSMAAVLEDTTEFSAVDGSFETDATFEVALPASVKAETKEQTEVSLEPTYTKESALCVPKEESASELDVVETGKAVAKRLKKDGTTGRLTTQITAAHAAPATEATRLEHTADLPSLHTHQANMEELPRADGASSVSVEPTFVHQQTEKATDQIADRFNEKKPATDFAKKAVIQPTKLDTAKTTTVETRVAEKPKLDAKKAVSPAPPATKTVAKPATAPAKTAAVAVAKPAAAETKTCVGAKPAEAKPSTPVAAKKELEDKTAVRKSALNMTLTDAKKKAKEEEEAAKAKARRSGTVSAMMDRFKEPPKEEPIVYKRSSRLTQKDEDRPKRTYQVVKPVINDDFDKQMEELRQQMKAGSKAMQNQMSEMRSDINLTQEELKAKEAEEKRKKTLNAASGVFSKAEEERERWKKQRDAEAEKDYARIEAERHVRKKTVVEEAPKVVEHAKPAPKKTVRMLKDKSPAPPAPAAAAAAATTTADKPRTTQPVNKPATANSKKAEPAVKKVEEKAAPAPAPSSTGKSVVAAPAAPALPKSGEAVKGRPAVPPPPPAVPATREPEQSDIMESMHKMTKPKSPLVKRGLIAGKIRMPDAKVEVNDDNFELLAAAMTATKRRKSIAEIKAKKEMAKEKKDVKSRDPSKETDKKDALATAIEGSQAKTPKGDGAAATKIRNALGNATNRIASPSEKSPAASERAARRYSGRRKTQELMHTVEQPQTKKRRIIRHTRHRFIATKDVFDIDIVLGWGSENSFEAFEKMMDEKGKDRIRREERRRGRRVESTRVWISELQDIDKIYKGSELRDIERTTMEE